MNIKFGWLDYNEVIDANFVKIIPIENFSSAIDEVNNSSQKDNIWYYPPIVYENDKPEVVRQRFELPLTHYIEQKRGIYNKEFLEFIVVFFGWLHGLRLNPAGWGHLIKTPIKQNTLVDFIVLNPYNMNRLIMKAEEFWFNNAAEQEENNKNLLMGALNWFSYTQSYEQVFERFMGQYMVFDTLYKIVEIKYHLNGVSHTARFEHVCENLNLNRPSWINDISGIRNKLIHESKFAGKPIGFAYSSECEDILKNLIAFNCRVIAALIGANGRYSRSNCESRQQHGFDID